MTTEEIIIHIFYHVDNAMLEVPKGGSFADMVALQGDKEIGDWINKIITKETSPAIPEPRNHNIEKGRQAKNVHVS